ncbi:succinylglutamate desuccinylase/aspartoacylase family protein [Marinobacter sp.]|uniref:succinylglutamate desuccinylase/aspartoacylase family protein n=1 Tax=Marinobacter sp. TaxID=50741 RepID=UPI003562937A
MLFRRFKNATFRSLPFLMVAATLPGLMSAEENSDDEQNSDVIVAQLAEDENVEDVVRSEPREGREPGSGGDSPATELRRDENTPEKLKIAPNIDLKKVTPRPEADTETEAGSDTQPGEEEITPDAEQPEVPVPAESFTLLGQEILPGTSTRLAWSPEIQIAGLSQITPVLVVNGVNAGPTLCLTGAIHGDELNGIEIIRRTMYDLNPEKLTGRVIGVPIVNLTGFQQGSRYLPDRRDLNRYFPGRENGNLADRVAYSLFENVIRQCDMLVDIHTGSLKRTNLPQLRADMNNADVAEFTRGFDRMAVVHSSGSAGMLRTAAVEAGITAVTLEAGESLRIQEHQIEAGVNSLNSLMDKHGMISRMFVWGDPEPVYYDSTWVRAEHGGILFSEIELGAKVSEGEVLGYVSDPITNAQHPIRSSSNGRVIGMAVDQVVMAGFAAYHIGTEAEVPGE